MCYYWVMFNSSYIEHMKIWVESNALATIFITLSWLRCNLTMSCDFPLHYTLSYWYIIRKCTWTTPENCRWTVNIQKFNHRHNLICLGSIFSCHSATLMMWLGLGTKTTWLGLEKHYGFSENTCFFWSPQKWTTWIYHKVSLKISNGVLLWMRLWYTETFTANILSWRLGW